MIDRNVLDGVWHSIKTEMQFEKLLAQGTEHIRKGTFQGPGHYKMLIYEILDDRYGLALDVAELVTINIVQSLLMNELHCIDMELGEIERLREETR